MRDSNLKKLLDDNKIDIVDLKKMYENNEISKKTYQNIIEERLPNIRKNSSEKSLTRSKSLKKNGIIRKDNFKRTPRSDRSSEETESKIITLGFLVPVLTLSLFFFWEFFIVIAALYIVGIIVNAVITGRIRLWFGFWWR